jgi:Ran GTPase-activating protein (RanGAP) involved in mRNA processing and transport
MKTSSDLLSTGSTTERKHRRWFSYSLKTLLLVVTVLCVLLCWKLQAVNKQRQAVSAIRKVGGDVIYDFEKEPHWLARFVGIDFLHDVIDVRIHINSEGPQDIHSIFPYLSQLRRLKILSIYDGIFKDEDLRYLAGLTDLVSVELYSNSITGDGFKYLTDQNKLTFLELHDNPITDKSLSAIASLPSLTWLSLSECALTDDCLPTLIQMKSLRRIDVVKSQMTPEGERRLKEQFNELRVNLPPTVW